MIKKVGYALYTHKSNLNELYMKLNKEDINRLNHILEINTFPYEIIKFDRGNISLIECDTWNILNEPIVGDSHLYKLDGTIKLIKGNKMVYHSKELFVNSNYDGFDINKAKQRTIEWNNIPNIKSLKNKIGYKDFWYKLLEENNIEI